MGYNGWSNVETWRASLWLTGDNEGTYHRVVDLADCAHRAADDADERERVLADYLRDLAEDVLGGPAGEGGWLGDIVIAELGRVDWREIARSVVEGEELPDYDDNEEGDDVDP